MLLLATDLDGTFLGGQTTDKEILYQFIRERIDIKLVFVTGRGLGTVLPVLNDVAVPKPDYIICDVGATIINGNTLEPIQPLQSIIEEKWGGSTFIYDQLKEVKGLSLQEVPQSRRCSFYYNSETDFAHLHKVADTINCDVIKSAGKFVDILPHGVNKGYSLKQLINLLNISPAHILVAGDTMNDLSLYETGYKGVVVGEAEKDLLEATTSMNHVYQASRPGCGGILEAFDYFRIFDH
jgi:HAD superfamily hydrolase (TIGR01484 family)